MTSWLTWPIDWLARELSVRSLKELQGALANSVYVDVNEWARINHISKRQAQLELDRGVKGNILRKMFLYEGGDSPVTFVIPEERLDAPIKLSELGCFEGEDRELIVSRFRSRPVYVRSHS
jgi:hypothetical protein